MEIVTKLSQTEMNLLDLVFEQFQRDAPLLEYQEEIEDYRKQAKKFHEKLKNALVQDSSFVLEKERSWYDPDAEPEPTPYPRYGPQ